MSPRHIPSPLSTARTETRAKRMPTLDRYGR